MFYEEFASLFKFSVKKGKFPFIQQQKNTQKKLIKIHKNNDCVSDRLQWIQQNSHKIDSYKKQTNSVKNQFKEIEINLEEE